MCVAAIINKPVSWDFLKNMEDDNPHGAGVAFRTTVDGAPRIKFMRGLTAAEIAGMQEWGDITYPYLLHFRWATHGPKVPELTHPFPIGPRAFFGELEGFADDVLIHNGVWSQFDKWLELVDCPAALLEKTSDSAVAAWLVGAYPELRKQLLDDMPWAVATARLSKHGDMLIEQHGDTWKEFEGNTYSNLQWLPSKQWWTADGGHIEPIGTSRHYSKVLGGYYEYPAPLKEVVKPTTEQVSWEEYVRSRYGHELADELAEAILQDGVKIEVVEGDPAGDEVFVVDMLDMGDFVSEDAEDVNKWLEIQSARKVG